MTALADARPTALDPLALADSHRQREDFARILAGEHQGRVKASSSRRRTRIVPVGALATLAASAVAVSVLIEQGTHQTASTGESAPRPSLTAAPLSGRLQLLAAAKEAEASAKNGTYWQVTTQTQDVEVVGNPGRRYSLRSTGTDLWSVGVRPGTGSLLVSGLNASTQPRAAADTRRWQEDGSPRQVDSPMKLGSPVQLRHVLGESRPTVMHTNAGNKIYALGPNNVSYQDLQQLPTNTEQLRAKLLALYAQDDGADALTEWMLHQTAGLITMPVKPGTRAAAYRLIASLPGIKINASATDPLGRKGVGITLPVKAATLLGSQEELLVVDPSNGDLLSDQYLLVKPSDFAQDAGLKGGSTVNYEATTRMAWSNHQITVPKNAKQD
ncbi:CU044_5270 family protein [Streptomyces sp. 8L]|uniref:CU044_5270 family protein n=1 Tax=Streptomyces sp. 8L TaxID=2877242 RepID=UPI001CD2C640|nr:CU044_5270 family protein [Streptomyces sp. 8L]MCA1224239.1 CU044_5270 family protein [Streptomyces sp. 8L]